MEDLFISGDPLLESVGLHEPLVEELRASITNAMHKAMIPLHAYAKEFKKYLELSNNDINTFLKYVHVCVHACLCVCLSVCAFSPSHPANHPLLLHTAFRTYQNQCPSAEAVREVVLTHLKEKEILDNSLPSSIIIGPFYINVDNVKQSLSKKLKALATSMLDILARNLHKEVDSVSNSWPQRPWPHTSSLVHVVHSH